jgi:hypothetical protein
MRTGYKTVIRKTEGKTSLWRFWRRWEDDIKMDIKYIR